jgi:zinc protease
MDAPPARGSVTRTTAVDGTGITVWTLSNGATVVLRPTTLKADQILFRAVAPAAPRWRPMTTSVRAGGR